MTDELREKIEAVLRDCFYTNGFNIQAASDRILAILPPPLRFSWSIDDCDFEELRVGKMLIAGIFWPSGTVWIADATRNACPPTRDAVEAAVCEELGVRRG